MTADLQKSFPAYSLWARGLLRTYRFADGSSDSLRAYKFRGPWPIDSPKTFRLIVVHKPIEGPQTRRYATKGPYGLIEGPWLPDCSRTH